MTVQTVIDASGRQLPLGPALSTSIGHEGTVREVRGAPDLAVKLLHDPARAGTRLQDMLSLGSETFADSRLVHRWVAWPTSTVHDETGSTLGYVMPRVDRDAVLLGWLYGRELRAQQHLDVSWRWILRAAIHVATACWWAEARGRCAPDLGEGNAYVGRFSALATLIDADGMPRPNEPVRALAPNLMAPELLNGEEHADAGSAARWSLAVVVVRLLMDGEHPWAGWPLDDQHTATPDVQTNVRSGHCRLLEPEAFADVAGSVPARVLPPQIETLARRAFAAGYAAPGSRPSPKEWAEALHGADQDLERCRRSARHVFHPAAGGCPWCTPADRPDPFPEPRR